jgi:hypothetical protein
VIALGARVYGVAKGSPNAMGRRAPTPLVVDLQCRGAEVVGALVAVGAKGVTDSRGECLLVAAVGPHPDGHDAVDLLKDRVSRCGAFGRVEAPDDDHGGGHPWVGQPDAVRLEQLLLLLGEALVHPGWHALPEQQQGLGVLGPVSEGLLEHRARFALNCETRVATRVRREWAILGSNQ